MHIAFPFLALRCSMLLVLWALLPSAAAMAQDMLQKLDGTRLEVTVLEVTDTHIRYRLQAQPEGPVYVIAKDDVIRIVYESGKAEIIPKSPLRTAEYREEPDERTTDFGRHFISMNMTDVLFEFVTLNYEHTFRSGKHSIKVPVSVGLRKHDRSSFHNTYRYYNPNKVFSTGLDYYFYPWGQGKVRFFYGPSLEFGRVKDYYTYFAPGINQEINTEVMGTFRSVLLQSGLLFQFTRHFNAALNGGIGLSDLTIDYSRFNANRKWDRYESGTTGAIRASFAVGYKF